MCRIFAGIFAVISGVRPSASGSRPGSPSGSEPSGSSRAARWPWLRKRESSVLAACTACSSSSSGTALGALSAAEEAAAEAAAAGAGGDGSGAELDAERREHVLVEAVLALQVLLDLAQEAP